MRGEFCALRIWASVDLESSSHDQLNEIPVHVVPERSTRVGEGRGAERSQIHDSYFFSYFSAWWNWLAGWDIIRPIRSDQEN